MTLLVDTSVWSLALRRDGESSAAQVGALREALEGDEIVVTTGLILQELLQGFAGPRSPKDIVERFAALPIISPDRQDHIAAAALRKIGTPATVPALFRCLNDPNYLVHTYAYEALDEMGLLETQLVI